ncbi:hypothetical protein B0H14DRAFT_2645184 [Mycena olivaceomarginata]|nr:hypothetical protein B0H14DRAFT_2645184 [Mycena olivaceomarginata]
MSPRTTSLKENQQAWYTRIEFGAYLRDLLLPSVPALPKHAKPKGRHGAYGCAVAVHDSAVADLHAIVGDISACSGGEAYPVGIPAVYVPLTSPVEYSNPTMSESSAGLVEIACMYSFFLYYRYQSRHGWHEILSPAGKTTTQHHKSSKETAASLLIARRSDSQPNLYMRKWNRLSSLSRGWAPHYTSLAPRNYIHPI